MKKLLNHRLFLINSWSFDLAYVCETVYDIKDSKDTLYLSVYFTLSVDILSKQIFSFKFIKCLIQFSIKYCGYYQNDRILITYTSLRNNNDDKDTDSSYWHRRNTDKIWSCAIKSNQTSIENVQEEAQSHDIAITKTCLFKYAENFTNKKWKFSDKKNLIFFIFLLKA